MANVAHQAPPRRRVEPPLERTGAGELPETAGAGQGGSTASASRGDPAGGCSAAASQARGTEGGGRKGRRLPACEGSAGFQVRLANANLRRGAGAAPAALERLSSLRVPNPIRNTA